MDIQNDIKSQILALYIQDYYQSISRSRNSIDSIITSLSSSIIIISCGFILHYKDQSNWLPLIVLAWMFLLASFVLTFISYHMSIQMTAKEAEKATISLMNKDIDYAIEKDVSIDVLNVLSSLFFCLGISLIIVFAVINIFYGKICL